MSLKEHSPQNENSELSLLNVGRKNAATFLCASFLLRTDLQERKGMFFRERKVSIPYCCILACTK